MSLLDLLLRRHAPLALLGRLHASILDGLHAERQVVRLQRSLDVSAGIARDAHQRLDRLTARLTEELRTHRETDQRLIEARAAIEQLRADNEELTGTSEWAKRELEDMRRIYQQLRDEVIGTARASIPSSGGAGAALTAAPLTAGRADSTQAISKRLPTKPRKGPRR